MRLLALLMSVSLLANAQTPFEKVVDQFYQEYFRFAPSEGTAVGFHQYDSQLENYSPSDVEAQRKMFHKYLPQFERFPPSDDRDLMVSKIKAQLLALDNIPYWKTNPDFYSSGVTESIFSLISRKFAPPPSA